MNEFSNITTKSAKFQEIGQEDTSIVTALNAIMEASFHSEMEEKELAQAANYFNFLTEKLSISRIQALIIGILIDANKQLPTNNIANFLGLRNIAFLKYMPELKQLIKRKIVRECKEHFDNSPVYEICEEAQAAYMNNQVYIAPNYKNLSLTQFIDSLTVVLEKCNQEKLSKSELQNEILEMSKLNQRLFVCKGLQEQPFPEQLFFYYCLVKFVTENDETIHPMEISEYVNPIKSRQLCSSLGHGKSDLIVKHFIESSGTNGFNREDCYTIGEDLKNRLIIELNMTVVESKDEIVKGLKLHDSISEKQLFYNSSEESSINELTDILSIDKFSGIQERLTAHGMRKGFACLFYGAPGTGKTESVLQLARSTGRDIMEVNIASIKSKWVGDSEKNIKNIFLRYRNYCEKCKELPILFFNEADAIISKRSEDTERSVDKMENAFQNIILEEMENLDGILIATTNLTANMDKAFERRFLYKIEFKQPEVNVRAHIWQSMLKDLTYEEAQHLASSYNFSGGQIENIARKEIIYNILKNETTSLKQIEFYCQSELLNKEVINRRRIGFN